MADVIRAELLEIVKRIELPCAEPAFGSKENALNIKKALLSGYFMQARMGRAWSLQNLTLRTACQEVSPGMVLSVVLTLYKTKTFWVTKDYLNILPFKGIEGLSHNMVTLSKKTKGLFSLQRGH